MLAQSGELVKVMDNYTLLNEKEMAQLLNHINEYPDAYGPDINLKYLIRHVQTNHLVQFVYDKCIFDNLKDQLFSKHLFK